MLSDFAVEKRQRSDDEREAAIQFIGLAMAAALICLSAVQWLVFGWITVQTHRQLMKRYAVGSPGSTTRRINDFDSVRYPLGVITLGPSVLLAFMFFLVANITSGSLTRPGVIFATGLLVALGGLWLWWTPILFRWLAVAHFGVVVDPAGDRIAFVCDQQSYDIQDYLKLRFVSDLPRMDEVRLSDIERMTRQEAFDLFIHGAFGSRRIRFTKKQKRDECIYAIHGSKRSRAAMPVEFGV